VFTLRLPSRPYFSAAIALTAVFAALLIFSFRSIAQSSAVATQQPITMEPASGAPKSLQFFSVPTEEGASQAAVSPDGNSLAYCRPAGDGCTLTLHNLETQNEKELLQIPHGRCSQIAFAADGKTLFYALGTDPRGSLTTYRLPLAGGPPVFVAHGMDSRMSVSPDGNVIAFLRKDAASGNLQIVAAQADASGERVLFHSTDEDTISPVGPAWSPGGTEIAFARHNRSGGTHLFALNVASGHAKQIGGSQWPSITEVFWLPDFAGLAVVGGGFVAPNKTSIRHGQLWYVDYASGNTRQLTDGGAFIWSLTSAGGGSPLYAALALPEYSVTIATLDPADNSPSAHALHRLTLPLLTLCQHEPVTWMSQTELGFLCESPKLGEQWKTITISASSSGNPVALSAPSSLHCTAKNPRFISYLPTIGTYILAPSAQTNEYTTRAMLAILPPCMANGRQSAYVLQPVGPAQPAPKLPNGEYLPFAPLRPEGARAAALSPGGQLIATFSEPDAHGATRLFIYDGKGDRILASYDIPAAPGISLRREAIRWTPDGSAVAYLLHDRFSNVWEQRVDIANPSHPAPPVQVTHLKEGMFSGFDVSPDGKLVALDVSLYRPEVVRITGLH
jgi:Tol biopolymer transport system component